MLLVIGFTLTAAVILFMGILMGQGIERRKLLNLGRPDPASQVSAPQRSQSPGMEWGGSVNGRIKRGGSQGSN